MHILRAGLLVFAILTKNSNLLKGSEPFWTTWSNTQSMRNHSRTWKRKKLSGSHLNKNDTAQDEQMPKSMHSVKGSRKMVNGTIAARNLTHLKPRVQCSSMSCNLSWIKSMSLTLISGFGRAPHCCHLHFAAPATTKSPKKMNNRSGEGSVRNPSRLTVYKPLFWIAWAMK